MTANSSRNKPQEPQQAGGTVGLTSPINAVVSDTFPSQGGARSFVALIRRRATRWHEADLGCCLATAQVGGGAVPSTSHEHHA
jgi:hypothetical protein